MADAISRHPVGDHSTDESPDNKPCAHMTYLSTIRILDPHPDVACVSSHQDSDLIQSAMWHDVQPAKSNDDSMPQLHLLIERQYCLLFWNCGLIPL